MAKSMPSKRLPATIWGAMVICGTVAGAGMFTLPVVMAGAWFSWSVLLLVVSWGCMLLSGLLFMQASLWYPEGSGFDTLTRDLTSRVWSQLNGLSILFVLGILTYAYISASAPVYHTSLNRLGLAINEPATKIVLTFLVALVVWLGTAGVSRFITFCLVAKILLFFILFGGVLTQVQPQLLFRSNDTASNYLPYLLGVFPFCLASFGFHGNITVLISYYSGNKRKITHALLAGTLLALLLYLVWIICTMGNIPRQTFPAIAKQGGDIAALLAALKQGIHVNALNLLLDIFAHFAVICSFLGVTAGLFDFIRDKLQLTTDRRGRTLAVLATFVPPLLASLLFPQGFLLAIGYAGLFATLWALFTPALLICRAQRKFSPQPLSFSKKMAVFAVVTFGIVNIIAWTLSQCHLLPEFLG
jgi:tryptophan-specific transport protein